MTKSNELAEKFTSGSTFPILDEMLKEFPVNGIQGNRVISEHQFASYLFGYLAGIVANEEYADRTDYGYLDDFLFQENNKKDWQFQKSLIKPIFVRVADEKFSKLEREIYSTLLLYDKKECNGVKFAAGFFRKISSKK